MASSSRTIRVRFDGDVDGLLRASAEADRAVTGFQQKMSLVAAAIAGAATVAAPALLAGATLLFAGIAAAGVFQSQRMIDTYKAMGTTVKNQLAEDSKVLGSTFVAVSKQIGDAFTGIRPILQDTFKFIGPQITTLTAGVLGLVTNALPGLSNAAKAGTQAVQGLSNMLKDTGTGVSQLFDNITKAAPRAGLSLSALGSILKDALAVLGVVLAVLSNFASGALPILAAGFSVITTTVGSLLNFIEPLAPALGAASAAALGLFLAFKGVGLAVAGITAITGAVKAYVIAVQGAAVYSNFLVTGLTGSAAAGASASSAVRSLGVALPILAIAIAAVTVAAGAVTISMDTATAAFEKGGSAAQDMTAQLRHQQQVIDGNTSGFGSEIDAILKWVGVNVLGQATLESTTAAVKAHRDSLDAVGRAQLDETIAAGNYQKALDDQTSRRRGADAEVISSQKALADATSNVKHAEEEAAQATKSYAEKLADLVNQLDSVLSKDLAYSDALANNIQKEKDAADAVKQHGAKSAEARTAQEDLQKAYQQSAQAAEAKATADNVGAGSEEAAKKGAEAYNIELSKLASQQKGPGRDAALGLIDRFNDSQLAAFNAGNATSGFGTKVLQLPSGRTVTIIADTAGALYSLQQIQDELAGIRSKSVNIQINQIGGVPIMPRASGGPVSMGRTYLVGEKGPELLTMAGNGFVTPNDKLTGMLGNPSPNAQDVAVAGAGGGGVNVSVYIDGQEFRGMIQTAISDDKRATKRTVSAGAGAAIV